MNDRWQENWRCYPLIPHRNTILSTLVKLLYFTVYKSRLAVQFLTLKIQLRRIHRITLQAAMVLAGAAQAAPLAEDEAAPAEHWARHCSPSPAPIYALCLWKPLLFKLENGGQSIHCVDLYTMKCGIQMAHIFVAPITLDYGLLLIQEPSIVRENGKAHSVSTHLNATKVHSNL